MNNNKNKSIKLIAFLMAIFFIAFISYANIMVQTCKYSHDCTGEHCPICTVIQAAETILNTLGYVKVNLNTFAVLFFALVVTNIVTKSYQNTTLVALKVRMDN